ncbi:hypothetical protein GZH46_01967 [Fragariocoptes setiger]|uniref:Uncharacterized protein n=1 Tax=Fragariocoptes setiger TaxID=1670756 RepID=A0ABQ7S813_9ACAR|nr:hypothetical protein GZH46_01967 [Fragariocoptes setiger]
MSTRTILLPPKFIEPINPVVRNHVREDLVSQHRNGTGLPSVNVSGLRIETSRKKKRMEEKQSSSQYSIENQIEPKQTNRTKREPKQTTKTNKNEQKMNLPRRILSLETIALPIASGYVDTETNHYLDTVLLESDLIDVVRVYYEFGPIRCGLVGVVDFVPQLDPLWLQTSSMMTASSATNAAQQHTAAAAAAPASTSTPSASVAEATSSSQAKNVHITNSNVSFDEPIGGVPTFESLSSVLKRAMAWFNEQQCQRELHFSSCQVREKLIHDDIGLANKIDTREMFHPLFKEEIIVTHTQSRPESEHCDAQHAMLDTQRGSGNDNKHDHDNDNHNNDCNSTISDKQETTYLKARRKSSPFAPVARSLMAAAVRSMSTVTAPSLLSTSHSGSSSRRRNSFDDNPSMSPRLTANDHSATNEQWANVDDSVKTTMINENPSTRSMVRGRKVSHIGVIKRQQYSLKYVRLAFVIPIQQQQQQPQQQATTTTMTPRNETCSQHKKNENEKSGENQHLTYRVFAPAQLVQSTASIISNLASSPPRDSRAMYSISEGIMSGGSGSGASAGNVTGAAAATFGSILPPFVSTPANYHYRSDSDSSTHLSLTQSNLRALSASAGSTSLAAFDDGQHQWSSCHHSHTIGEQFEPIDSTKRKMEIYVTTSGMKVLSGETCIVKLDSAASSLTTAIDTCLTHLRTCHVANHLQQQQQHCSTWVCVYLLYSDASKNRANILQYNEWQKSHQHRRRHWRKIINQHQQQDESQRQQQTLSSPLQTCERNSKNKGQHNAALQLDEEHASSSSSTTVIDQRQQKLNNRNSQSNSNDVCNNNERLDNASMYDDNDKNKNNDDDDDDDDSQFEFDTVYQKTIPLPTNPESTCNNDDSGTKLTGLPDQRDQCSLM